MALAQVIAKIFGSKADRDYKAVKPILDKILAAYPDIDRLSDDDLRARSAALRQKLRDVEEPFETRIAEIKVELDQDIPVSEKEKLANESDKLVKDEDEAIEKALNEILPEAFAHSQRHPVRPRPQHRPRFREHPGRQGRLHQFLESRRQHDHLGHGPL